MIVDKRVSPDYTDEYEYKVKWKRWSEEHNSWEPLVNLSNSMKLLVEYERQRQEREIGRSALTVESYTCHECGEVCSSGAKLAVHCYRAHGNRVPTDANVIVPTDKQLIEKLQQAEPEFAYIYESECGSKDTDMSKAQRQSFQHHEFVMGDDGLLYCIDMPSVRGRERVSTYLRLCLPSPLRHDLLTEVHRGTLSGHPGMIRMYDQLRRRVWWPSMIKQIVKTVESCVACQRTKMKPRLCRRNP